MRVGTGRWGRQTQNKRPINTKREREGCLNKLNWEKEVVVGGDSPSRNCESAVGLACMEPKSGNEKKKACVYKKKKSIKKDTGGVSKRTYSAHEVSQKLNWWRRIVPYAGRVPRG